MEIATKWAERFNHLGARRAYLEGARAALEYAATRCHSGSTPSMIRYDLLKKIREIATEGENGSANEVRD